MQPFYYFTEIAVKRVIKNNGIHQGGNLFFKKQKTATVFGKIRVYSEENTLFLKNTKARDENILMSGTDVIPEKEGEVR